MQLMINAFYGTAVSVGLWLIGVPHPLLWGLLAFVLRFVPYVGPAVAAGMPIIIAVAGEPGWTKPLMAIALFAGLELLINNVLEPWLYGSSTGLSPIAILVAAVFWTTLLGCGRIAALDPVDGLPRRPRSPRSATAIFEVLLGSEPVLEPEVKLYQRLLAADFEEAARVSEEYLREHGVQDLYDRVLVPALAFADQDRMRGALDRERWTAVAAVDRRHRATTCAPSHRRRTWTMGRMAARAEVEPTAHPRPIVLCVGARNDLDEAAAAMLAHLLAIAEFDARVLAGSALATSDLGSSRRDRPIVFCLSLRQSRSPASRAKDDTPHTPEFVARRSGRFWDCGTAMRPVVTCGMPASVPKPIARQPRPRRVSGRSRKSCDPERGRDAFDRRRRSSDRLSS